MFLSVGFPTLSQERVAFSMRRGSLRLSSWETAAGSSSSAFMKRLILVRETYVLEGDFQLELMIC